MISTKSKVRDFCSNYISPTSWGVRKHQMETHEHNKGNQTRRCQRPEVAVAVLKHIFNLKDICQSSGPLAGEDEFTLNEKPF